MSDKIASFEDYVKRDANNEQKKAGNETKPAEPSAPKKEPVPEKTMEIEIEDPFQFLNEQEREEYILQRQKDALHEESDEEYDEEYDDEEYDEEYQEEDKPGINMNLVVRIASIITGVVILAFVGMFIKVKVFDRFFAPDPDSQTQTVIQAIPVGYTEKNDTVVVSGASFLNLRSAPSTGSNDTIVAQVSEGTEIKRIAVSDDGTWALLDYNGQQLYGSMKYLKAK
jgi:CRISPR/Cas system-associated endonuclease/helicase Cas3